MAEQVMNEAGNTTDGGGVPYNRPDTLERLLAHWAALSPHKTCLVDPPNRNLIERRSDNLPQYRFTFKTLNETVNDFALRFHAIGLQPGDYIGMQLANFIEAPVLVLAAMRAGLVPCLIPLSWSIEDIARSFERLKPVALASCGQIEDQNLSHNMRELAFSHLHIRFVLGAGYDIADGVTDLTPLLSRSETERKPALLSPAASGYDINDIALVTYIDPLTPVPHSNGQILSGGLLHVLETGLSTSDEILDAWPLSSLPGLTAHLYPWLISGSCLSLHQPFQFDILSAQLQEEKYSYFAGPAQVIGRLLKSNLPLPEKLVIVQRDTFQPAGDLSPPRGVDFVDLWNIGGLGCIPVKWHDGQTGGLFRDGQICLPADDGQESRLCLAAGKISNNHLFIKGRIFPRPATLASSLAWFSLKKRLENEWLDTGLTAVYTTDNSILPVGGSDHEPLQKNAS